MLTGEVKQRLIAVLSELVARHQRARAQVTEEVHDSSDLPFFTVGFLQHGRFTIVSLVHAHALHL